MTTTSLALLSEWRFGMQMEELCFKFDNDNDDLEQNKQVYNV